VRKLLEGAAKTTRLERFGGDRQSRVSPREAEISVLFCGDARMRALNRRYRDKDRSTDVLAFPSGEAGPFLGDLVVSVPYASRQARRRSEPLPREIDRLLVHGFLHLLGYDHETDRGEMDALEARVRRRLGIEERASAAARGGVP
jgi:probable rRNA maturation factor